jgi:hypothetical protein
VAGGQDADQHQPRRIRFADDHLPDLGEHLLALRDGGRGAAAALPAGQCPGHTSSRS